MAAAPHGEHGASHGKKAASSHAGGHHHHGPLGHLLLGAGLVTAAIVSAPLLFYGADALGIVDVGALGSNAYWADTWIMHMCGSGIPTGLAETSGNLLSHVPLIGSELAKGGMTNAVVSGIVGVGGRILGNYMNKNDDGSSSIRWGNVIKTATLVTSLLVASPAIFTALSMGVTAIGIGSGLVEIGKGQAFEIMQSATKFFGTTGYLNTSGMLGSLGAIGPHLATCIAPVVAASGTLFGHNKQEERTNEFRGKRSFAEQVTYRRERVLEEQYPALF